MCNYRVSAIFVHQLVDKSLYLGTLLFVSHFTVHDSENRVKKACKRLAGARQNLFIRQVTGDLLSLFVLGLFYYFLPDVLEISGIRSHVV